MRLFRLGPLIACAALSLAALPCETARAETRVFVVYGNMGADDSGTRGLLQDRLRIFARDVKPHRTARTLRPVLQFQVLPEPRLNADAAQVVGPSTRQLWRSLNPVAFVWGRIDPRPRGERVHIGNIYIGLTSREGVLPARSGDDLFGPVEGTVTPRAIELDAYEIIIGYALLRRVWREENYALTVPIAAVLKERIDALDGGGSWGSWQNCLERIRQAIGAIPRARVPTRPAGTRPPPDPPSPEPVSCS